MALTRNAAKSWSERREAVARVFRDTRSELRKVTWPSRETTINLTLLVIGLAVFLGLVLGGVDLLFAEAFRWLSAAFGG